MNKQTIFQCCFILFVGSFCQTAYAQISIGIRGGILINDIDKSPLETDEPAPENVGGFQIAVPIEIGIGDMFAIQPEIMFGSHAGRQEANNDVTQFGIRTVSSFNIKYQINSLEIPLLAKLRFGSDDLKFHVLAGPSFGLALNGKYSDERSIRSTLADGTVILDQNTDATLDAKFVKDGYDPNEVGSGEFAVSQTNLNVHFGAGLSINIGGAFVFFDGRYMLGLNDLRPEAEGDSKDVSYKSKRIGASVGIFFPL